MKRKAFFSSIPFMAIVALMLTFSPASALLIGGQDIIAAPEFAIDDSPGAENDHMQAFNEVQNYFLSSAIDVDGGSIGQGITVDSHMIFLNTEGMLPAQDRATWTFDGVILGVMSDRYGTLEAATSSFLGAPGTIYPSSFNARGMELGDWYQVSGNSIEVYMAVSEPGDWIRVVTESSHAPVPEPATMLLLGTGLIGLAYSKRKKFKK